MGMGDVKLAFLMGAALGRSVLPALMLAMCGRDPLLTGQLDHECAFDDVHKLLASVDVVFGVLPTRLEHGQDWARGVRGSIAHIPKRTSTFTCSARPR
jgi:hypothetical protein